MILLFSRFTEYILNHLVAISFDLYLDDLTRVLLYPVLIFCIALLPVALPVIVLKFVCAMTANSWPVACQKTGSNTTALPCSNVSLVVEWKAH